MFKDLKPIETKNPKEVEGLSGIQISNCLPEQWKSFNKKTCCSTGPAHPEKAYVKTSHFGPDSSKKAGQHKLCLTEIQFLNIYWDPIEHPNPKVVYVGAAEGFHLVLLGNLFPMIEFHLYDQIVKGGSRDFHKPLNNMTNMFINRDGFGEREIDRWSREPSVFFISDIRTLQYIRETSTPEHNTDNEARVRSDMALQKLWVERIKPVRAHLKFRLPYPIESVKAGGDSEPYLDGDLYIQPWTGHRSTECRLVPFHDIKYRNWDYEKHQDQMFYHNVVTRMESKFINILTGTKESYSDEYGLTNDYDSTLTIYVLKCYLKKLAIEATNERVVSLAIYFSKGCRENTNLQMIRNKTKKQSGRPVRKIEATQVVKRIFVRP